MKTVSATAGWIAGAVALVPLVVVGGLIAIVALPTIAVIDRIRRQLATRRQLPAAPILPLEHAPANLTPDAVGQHAA